MLYQSLIYEQCKLHIIESIKNKDYSNAVSLYLAYQECENSIMSLGSFINENIMPMPDLYYIFTDEILNNENIDLIDELMKYKMGNFFNSINNFTKKLYSHCAFSRKFNEDDHLQTIIEIIADQEKPNAELILYILEKYINYININKLYHYNDLGELVPEIQRDFRILDIACYYKNEIVIDILKRYGAIHSDEYKLED